MISEAAIRTIQRLLIPTTIPRAGNSALSFGAPDPTASFIPVFASRVGNASDSSIPIALRIRSRGGIWITIGMALAWICFVISAVERSIVWSDRIALARVPGAIDRFHNPGSASRGDPSSSIACRGQGFDSPQLHQNFPVPEFHALSYTCSGAFVECV